MELQHVFLTNRVLRDLNPLVAGEQKCDPGYSFGPQIRRYVLLHYVITGKGKLYARGQVFPVESGQVFLIVPGEVTTYEADHQDPWQYRWIGFDGELSRQFTQLPPVFPLEEELFPNSLPKKDYVNREYLLAAELFRLYAALFQSQDQGNTHVQKVQTYIRSAYMQNITVEGIARELNLDRRYLSRLFKSHTGLSVQEYLLGVRMEEADRCLAQGCSVKIAAALSGYQDAANFSRMYKRKYGISPRQRRP